MNFDYTHIGWIGLFAISFFVAVYYMSSAIIDTLTGEKFTSGGGQRYAEGLEFYEQISPFVTSLKPLSSSLLSTMSSKDIEDIQKKLQEAGYTNVISLEEFIGMRIFAALVAGFIGLFVSMAIFGLHPLGFLAILLLAAIGYVYPVNWLQNEATIRQGKIFRGLSDTLDVLAVSVSAGLEMREALERVVAIGSEPLLDREIERTLQEIDKGGKSLEKGFEDLRDRISMPEMTAFVNVLLMAFRLGASGMGEILTEQADAIRKERVLRAERQANTMGSKILFPIAVFIFPAVIVTLLGPMALEAYLSFGM